MYSFIVLGQIPGTSVTISFTMWLETCALIIALTYLVHIHNEQLVNEWVTPRASRKANSVLQSLNA